MIMQKQYMQNNTTAFRDFRSRNEMLTFVSSKFVLK